MNLNKQIRWLEGKIGFLKILDKYYVINFNGPIVSLKEVVLLNLSSQLCPSGKE